jgi:DNA-directed RNA polymerase subunit RPC12/RpoP
MNVLTEDQAKTRGVLHPVGGAMTFPGSHGVELATYLCWKCGQPTISIPHNIHMLNGAIRCPSCSAINDLDAASRQSKPS